MPDHSDDAQGRPTPDSWQRSVGPVIVLILLVGSATASLLAPVLGVEAFEHTGVAALGVVAGVHALRCFWNAWRGGVTAMKVDARAERCEETTR